VQELRALNPTEHTRPREAETPSWLWSNPSVVSPKYINKVEQNI
jgi:hypothetical protein